MRGYEQTIEDSFAEIEQVTQLLKFGKRVAKSLTRLIESVYIIILLLLH